MVAQNCGSRPCFSSGSLDSYFILQEPQSYLIVFKIGITKWVSLKFCRLRVCKDLLEKIFLNGWGGGFFGKSTQLNIFQLYNFQEDRNFLMKFYTNYFQKV